MGNYDSGRASDFGGINVEARRADSLNGIRFDSNRSDPSSANDVILYRGAASSLRFWDGSSATTLGSAGALANFSLNDAYDDGESITVDAASVLLTGSIANPVLDITNSGAGARLRFNGGGGGGNDVTGTSSTWAVSSAGALTCISIADSATDATLQVDGNGTGGVTLCGTSTGAITLTTATTATVSLTITGSAGTNVFTVSNGDLVVSDGSLTMTDADEAAALVITNNTYSTTTAGIIDVNSSSLSTGNGITFVANGVTSGTMLYLETSDAGFSGFYIRCYDGAANVFSVGDEGAVIIVGNAGSDVLSITNGDVNIADGSITLVDADNASSLSITNNTAAAASLVEFIGSGTFTGTGSTAFLSIEPTGLVAGDAVNIQVDAATTGTALRIGSTSALVTTGALLELVADAATTAAGVVRLTADALSTGFAVLVESTSVALAAGQLLNVDHTASGAIVAKTGQLIDIVSSRENTAAAAISDNYDALSIIRTNISNNAGGTLNAAGSALYIQNVGTQTAGTLEDTANGVEIVMTGGAESQGNAIDITHSGTTVGRAINIAASQTSRDGVVQVTANSVDSGNAIVLDANGLTTGIGLELTHTTSVITTGSVCRITSTGVDTGTGQGTLLDLVSSGATAATVVSLVADAIVGGTGLIASFDGLTTGIGFNLTHATSVIAGGGSLLRVNSSGVDTSTTSGCVLDLIGSGSTAGTQFLQTYAALTNGVGMRMVANALTSGIMLDLESSAAGMAGSYIRCYDGAAVDFSVGVDGRLVVAGTAGITAIAVTAGDITTADGAIASAREQVTLGAAATAIAVDSNFVEVTGDAGTNSITTITGGVAGQILVLVFVDGLVTIVDDNTHAANTVDLVGANFTGADDATLTLIFDGTSWYQITQSVND